jgi:hypothetical protein
MIWHHHDNFDIIKSVIYDIKYTNDYYDIIISYDDITYKYYIINTPVIIRL